MAQEAKVCNADAADCLPTALAQLLAVVADPTQRHVLTGWHQRAQRGLQPEDRTQLGIALSQLVADRRLPAPMRQLAMAWALRLLGADHGPPRNDTGPATCGNS
jgi:hypothetical protein